jgi:hypothetical protein
MTVMSHSDRLERKDRDGASSYGVAVVLGLFIVFAVVALPFVPLLMALCEGALFHTRRVEDLCERIGIHDELGTLYQAVFELFQ